MKCPFRSGIKYDIAAYDKVVAVKKTEEFYPDCYEEECPYYEYPNGCAAVNKEISE